MFEETFAKQPEHLHKIISACQVLLQANQISITCVLSNALEDLTQQVHTTVLIIILNQLACRRLL